jgi:hypothetical protein
MYRALDADKIIATIDCCSGGSTRDSPPSTWRQSRELLPQKGTYLFLMR